MAATHWLFDKAKGWVQPEQIVYATWGERFALAALAICVGSYIVHDVVQTVVRTWTRDKEKEKER